MEQGFLAYSAKIPLNPLPQGNGSMSMAQGF